MNWVKQCQQKVKSWLCDTPESFTSAFREKEQMKERLEAALDQSTKRKGRAALVLAAAVILGVGGFAVWGISPTQKQTDTLRVLCVAPEYTGRYSEFKAMEKAKARFTATWPDVELTVEYFFIDESSAQNEEKLTQLRTQIMAGDGPDVLFSTGDLFLQNPAKQMEAGVFCDLTPYMEAEEEDLPPLKELVLQSGQRRGEQYVIPITYRVDFLNSTAERFARYGIDPGAVADRQAYLDTMQHFLEQNPQLSWSGGNRANADYVLAQTFVSLFPELCDLQNERLPLEDAQVRQWLELCRLEYERVNAYPRDASEQMPPEDQLRLLGLQQMNAVKQGETVDYLVARNQQGGTTGIVGQWAGVLASSKNQLNGWHFIRTMLDEEVLWAGTSEGENCGWVLQGSEEIVSQQISATRPLETLYGGTLGLEHYMDQVGQASAVVFTVEPYEVLLETFRPYFEGTAGYEECAQKAQNYWQIYRTE